MWFFLSWDTFSKINSVGSLEVFLFLIEEKLRIGLSNYISGWTSKHLYCDFEVHVHIWNVIQQSCILYMFISCLYITYMLYIMFCLWHRALYNPEYKILNEACVSDSRKRVVNALIQSVILRRKEPRTSEMRNAECSLTLLFSIYTKYRKYSMMYQRQYCILYTFCLWHRALYNLESTYKIL